MKTRFLYHAEAAAATGHITLPFQEFIEVPASASVPINGGHATSRAGNYNHRDILAFSKAEVHVVGAHSTKDVAHGTLSTVCIENLNILNVVTCDRIVLRLTSTHPDDGSEPSFIPLGSHFENLRIAGHPIEVDMATDLFTAHSTWPELSRAYESDAKFRAEFCKLSMVECKGSQLPESKGMLGVTLARNLGNLPGGLTLEDHGIVVPDFGTVYLGEYFLNRHSHRLLMLRAEMGSSVEGCYGVGSGQNNGQTFP